MMLHNFEKGTREQLNSESVMAYKEQDVIHSEIISKTYIHPRAILHRISYMCTHIFIIIFLDFFLFLNKSPQMRVFETQLSFAKRKKKFIKNRSNVCTTARQLNNMHMLVTVIPFPHTLPMYVVVSLLHTPPLHTCTLSLLNFHSLLCCY